MAAVETGAAAGLVCAVCVVAVVPDPVVVELDAEEEDDDEEEDEEADDDDEFANVADADKDAGRVCFDEC